MHPHISTCTHTQRKRLMHIAAYVCWREGTITEDELLPYELDPEKVTAAVCYSQYVCMRVCVCVFVYVCIHGG